MTLDDGGRGAVARAQDGSHGEGHNYIVGSPHLRHPKLRNRIDGRISDAIAPILQRKGSCAVLEIGAGHGSFTHTALSAGGVVTVTEMSRASSEYLSEKFHGSAQVRVIHDPDGNAPFQQGQKYDVILLISVVHHIPDYIDVLTRLCDEVLLPGGSLVTFQDPVWYPRQKTWAHAASQGAYLAWRVTRGDFRRGLATRWRRLRGVYSESNPSDLVEYHVVRQGVDELALQNLFSSRFATVELDRYFSTQSPLLQKVLERRLPANTFGILAQDRRK